MSPNKSPRLGLETLDERLVPAVVNLAQFGSEAFLANGAIVHRVDAGWRNEFGPSASGRGAMDNFLRLDANGTEQGYNTDARPLQFDQAPGKNNTEAITLSQVPVVYVNGVAYREFILNINEPRGGRTLSVDEVRVYLSGVNNLKNYNANNGKLGGVSPVYNLDSGEDLTIMLRSMLNQGAKPGEMALLVPDSVFASASPSTFVYLYSKLGATPGAGAAGGVEDWGVRLPPRVTPPPTPTGNATISGFVYVVTPNWTPADGTVPVPDGEWVGGISNVTIFLYDLDFNEIASATTDSEGKFTFSGLGAGSYIVVQDLDEQGNDPVYSDAADYATNGGVVIDDDQIQIDVVGGQTANGLIFTEFLGDF